MCFLGNEKIYNFLYFSFNFICNLYYAEKKNREKKYLLACACKRQPKNLKQTLKISKKN